MRLFWFGLLILSACVSRSVWMERFKESKALGLPPITISLVDPENFSFAFVGDLHIGGSNTTRFQKILQSAQTNGDEFIVLLGDLTDQGEGLSYQALQEALQDFGWEEKVLPLLGNHDIFSEGWKHYKSFFGSGHYSVDIGNSRFIALDSADGIIGKDQFEWLENKMSEPAMKNTFFLSHYMPVVPGQQTYLKLANFFEAEKLMALATREGVRAMLGGHYHSYCYEKIAGVDYVVAGGGGGRRMAPVRGYFYVQALVKGDQVEYRLHIVD